MTNNVDLLPISEDVLGAYLEGTLSPEEATRVEQLIHSDSTLSELVDIVNEVDASIEPGDSIYDEYPHFDETFRLPAIPVEIEFDEDDITPIDMVDMVDEDVDWDIADEPSVSMDDIDIIDADDFIDSM